MCGVFFNLKSFFGTQMSSLWIGSGANSVIQHTSHCYILIGRVQHLLLLMIPILLRSWEALYSAINKMIFRFNCHCGITSVYSCKIRCYLCMSNKISFPRGSWFSNNYDTTFLSVLLSKGRGTQLESTRLRTLCSILQANSGACCTGR